MSLWEPKQLGGKTLHPNIVYFPFIILLTLGENFSVRESKN